MNFPHEPDPQSGAIAQLFMLAIDQQQRINSAASEYEAASVVRMAQFTALEKLVSAFVETKRLLAEHGHVPTPMLTETAEIACKHINASAREDGQCPPPRSDLN